MRQRYEFWKDFITRRFLSNVAWDVFSQNVIASYADRAKSSPLVDRGFCVTPLETGFAQKFTEIFDHCPKVQIRSEDHLPNYFFEPRQSVHDYFNLTNNYFSLSEPMTATLQLFLNEHAQEIENLCQHPWRVVSTRLFSLNSGFNTGAIHLDGWPSAIKKIFIFPQGASPEIGTTFIKSKSGTDEIINSEMGIWMMFENSVVEHQAILPKTFQANPRRTIEIDIAPAIRTDATLVDAGLNGWYPWFPSTELDQVNSLYAPTKLADRMNRRISNLSSALDVVDYGIGVDDYLGPVEPFHSIGNEVKPIAPKKNLRRWLKSLANFDL